MLTYRNMEWCFLPAGTFGRVDVLPNDMQCARETRDVIIECCIGECVVFLEYRP